MRIGVLLAVSAAALSVQPVLAQDPADPDATA